MKFARYIQFNAVPEWCDSYLPYSSLKSLIYMIEKKKLASLTEHTALLSTNDNDNSTFVKALDTSLSNITQFYTERESEANAELDEILAPSTSPIVIVIHEPSTNTSPYLSLPASASSCSIDDGQISTADTMVPSHNCYQHQENDSQDERLMNLYLYLSKLKSFLYLNQTAFAKILKKYDKCMNTKLAETYTSHTLLQSYPFKPSTSQHLNQLIQQVETLYNEHATKSADLKMCLLETLKDDRNLVWRECIGRERRETNIVVEEEKANASWRGFEVKTWIYLALSLALFMYLLNSSLFEHVEQRRCFAILVLSSFLWAIELMPLFVTALLVPFLVIVLQVIRSEHKTADGTIVYQRLSAMEASKVVFASMLSPVIMLLLGGFAIAAALNKYGIAKALASFVLSKAGTRPSRVLLVNMLVASMASMWISNVAAPVLCLSLIQPILRALPVGSPFGPCLIMGITLASNLGGIASPIASPQNVIAIQNMSPPPSWTDWFCVSVPLCLLGNCIVWLWLLQSYQIKNDGHEITTTTNKVSLRMTPTQFFIVCVTLFTITLWCIARTYRDTLGDMGVIAIIPLIAFFGTGILTKDEFNNFLWNVIVLAMGGIALGKAVESSGLLHTIAFGISDHVMGFSTFEVLFIFCCLVLVIATFISHTVAALIALPIVAKIGAQLADPNPRLLVMGTAFVCSAAMGLPVSGFPNMTAISQENIIGEPYLRTKDFLKNGVPCSMLIMLCIVTLGYILMMLVGI
ncbi:4-aminobutyrate transaminase [Mucor velutinosus]|uniref:4-aminobutyrate transaminase n=1 Tax=Mucor velutinosus TaxID=708070 RepID=A0AAN7DN34_9FUNG|nr:4-aminobutyrate transaminase [Mucor velutinosus]